jgi:hypothetical protein
VRKGKNEEGRIERRRTSVVLPQRTRLTVSRHVDTQHRSLRIRQNRLDTKNGSVQRAIPQQAKTTGVRRDVTTDVARALGTEVEGHHVALGVEVVAEGFEDGTGIGGKDTCERVG